VFHYQADGCKTSVKTFDPKTIEKTKNGGYIGSAWEPADLGYGVPMGGTVTMTYDVHDAPASCTSVNLLNVWLFEFFETQSSCGHQYLYTSDFFGCRKPALSKICAESAHNLSIRTFDRYAPRSNKTDRQGKWRSSAHLSSAWKSHVTTIDPVAAAEAQVPTRGFGFRPSMAVR
jgi:hypothetical protein